MDANGACWSQSAHNTLCAGLLATAGVPSAFYFGTPPIPHDRYYTHHPPLLSLLLTALFGVFGEKESVARMLPITFSLIGAALLWLLVRNCASDRTATFCVLFFAAMPMELRYGRMVNFESVNLVWMLGGLLCLRYWEQTGRQRWRLLMLGAFALSLWTDWLGYLFVLVLCIHLFLSGTSRYSRLAVLLVGLLGASLALFLLQVHCVQPDAVRDLLEAIHRRMALTGIRVPWLPWSLRMIDSLTTHIQPVSWILGLGGGLLFWRSRVDESLRWLGWGGFYFVAMSVFYVVVFRNQSSIHDYASFYFTIPVAIGAGVALDSIIRWCERVSSSMRTVGLAATLVLYVLLVFSGERAAQNLRCQFHILGSNETEPQELIPELGRMISARFPPDTAVLCNFLPDYGPQLHYYAQRELLNCLFTPNDWKQIIADPENAPVGGVVWMKEPRAREVLSMLPPGRREEVTIRDIHFCLWRPE